MALVVAEYDEENFTLVAKLTFATNKRVHFWAKSWEEVLASMLKHVKDLPDNVAKETTASSSGGYVLVPHVIKGRLWVTAYVSNNCLADKLGIK